MFLLRPIMHYTQNYTEGDCSTKLDLVFSTQEEVQDFLVFAQRAIAEYNRLNDQVNSSAFRGFKFDNREQVIQHLNPNTDLVAVNKGTGSLLVDFVYNGKSLYTDLTLGYSHNSPEISIVLDNNEFLNEFSSILKF